MQKIYESPEVEQVSFTTEEIAIVMPDYELSDYSLKKPM